MQFGGFWGSFKFRAYVVVEPVKVLLYVADCSMSFKMLLKRACYRALSLTDYHFKLGPHPLIVVYLDYMGTQIQSSVSCVVTVSVGQTYHSLTKSSMLSSTAPPPPLLRKILHELSILAYHNS